MDTTAAILNALIRIQERGDLVRHGESETPGGLSLAETHCVHWVGELPEANMTRIAERMGMTRGAMSKLTKRLEGKGLLQPRRPAGNNKELRFVLTPAGERVRAEHARCHARAWASKQAVLEDFDEAERAVVLRFLERMGDVTGRGHAGSDAERGEAGDD